MELEVKSGSNFLVHLIRLGQQSRRNPRYASNHLSQVAPCHQHNPHHQGEFIPDKSLENFGLALVEVLKRRYRDHWFPEKPFRGSGYRCLRINGKIDPVIAQAAEKAAVNPLTIHATFPSELTMWIDPKEVSYRIGENGSICVLYEYKEGISEPWKPQITSLHLKQQQQQQQQKAALAHHSDDDEASSTTSSSTSSSICAKESLRNLDYLLDTRKSVSIEQLAAYVSS